MVGKRTVNIVKTDLQNLATSFYAIVYVFMIFDVEKFKKVL